MGIGQLRESSLHAALKDHFVQDGDLVEHEIEGYVIDIVRGDTLIEIQTSTFHALRKKLPALLETYQIQLIYPVAVNKWIVRLDEATGEVLNRRKSPRKGRPEDVFAELRAFPWLAVHPSLTLCIALTDQDEIQVNDGKGSWRRKGWSITDRRLLSVNTVDEYYTLSDYQRFIPAELPDPFTVKELASSLRLRDRLAGRMAYCLREMDAIYQVGKRGKAYLYTRSSGSA